MVCPLMPMKSRIKGGCAAPKTEHAQTMEQNALTNFFHGEFDRINRSCAREAGRHVGESPTRRVGLFTTERDINSVAARRGWKLVKRNERAIMKMNHIE